jgi:hypothetical protein
MVKSNQNSEKEKKNYLPVYIRIFMNHLQLLVLTASFDLEWPENLQSFFNALKPVSEFSSQFMSINCLLDERKNYSNNEERVFYSKLIIMSLSPIFVIICSSLTWVTIKKLKNLSKNWKSLNKTTKLQPLQ